MIQLGEEEEMRDGHTIRLLRAQLCSSPFQYANRFICELVVCILEASSFVTHLVVEHGHGHYWNHVGDDQNDHVVSWNLISVVPKEQASEAASVNSKVDPISRFPIHVPKKKKKKNINIDIDIDIDIDRRFYQILMK